MSGFIGLHVGRSWGGTTIEDECPCPKAACGLVISAEASPDCPQHGGDRNEKTMRQTHWAKDCPARHPSPVEGGEER